MVISEYRKLQIEQNQLNQKLDQITSKKVRENYVKNRLLSGSNSRITILSLKASQEIETKYVVIYGENWRENLSFEMVKQIEKIIAEEKRNARQEIEQRILSAKLQGRSLIRKRY